MIKKKLGGSIFMVMFSGTLSTNLYLLLLLDPVHSYSQCKSSFFGHFSGFFFL